MSVVIPVYNVEKYLRECLDSVIRQTLREIEIICVDDGSTDSSVAILEEYAKNDPRIRVVRQANGGPSVARNAGLDLARGKYVYFLDSDDHIDPDLCRMTWIASEYHQSDLLMFDLIMYGHRTNLEKMKDMPNLRFSDVSRDCGRNRRDRDIASLFANVWVWMKVFRADFLRENDLRFPEGVHRGEDLIHHWLSLIKARRIGILPAHLIFYRNRPLSLMQTKSVKSTQVFTVFQKLKDELDLLGLYETYKNNYIRQKLYDYYYSGYCRLHRSKRREVTRTMLETLIEDDWAYVDSDRWLEPDVRRFFKMLRGELSAKLAFPFYWWFGRMPREVLSSLGIGIWKTNLMHVFAKRFSRKYVQRNRELCRAIISLQEEVVEIPPETGSPQSVIEDKTIMPGPPHFNMKSREAFSGEIPEPQKHGTTKDES